VEGLEFEELICNVEPDGTVITKLNVFYVRVEIGEITGHSQLLRIKQRPLDTQVPSDCGVTGHMAMEIALQKGVHVQVSELQINQGGPFLS
jgi:hypothetical protein